MKINASLIREQRIKRGWSQEQLAMIAGLALRTVHRIENEGVASLESLMAIASAMSLDVKDLQESDSQCIPALTNRKRSLELLVRMALATVSGLLVAILLDLAIYRRLFGGDGLMPDNQLFAYLLCGMLFGLFVLYPFTAKKHNAKPASLGLIFSGGFSFVSAIYALVYSMEYIFGEAVESFLLASVVGGTIILLSARVLLKLVLPWLHWIAAKVFCLFSGAYMYLALLVLGSYEFLTQASIAGFCLWHGMLALLLFNSASSEGSGAHGETVLEPIICWLDDKTGKRFDIILKRWNSNHGTPIFGIFGNPVEHAS